MKILAALFAALLLAFSVCAQEPKPDTAAMRCQAQLTLIRADVIDGRLLELQAVKAKIEAANPAYVFDPQTFTVTAKPKATK
jgi:hypothetical protein